MTVTIKIPDSLSVDKIFALSAKLKQLLKSEEDHYIFDFQELGNAPPFGLLLTAHVLNDFIAFAGAASQIKMYTLNIQITKTRHIMLTWAFSNLSV